jgi:hypothetical protein
VGGDGGIGVAYKAMPLGLGVIWIIIKLSGKMIGV